MHTNIAPNANLRKMLFARGDMDRHCVPRNVASMDRLRLRRARKSANLTLEAVAELMGVSVSQVSRWEAGKGAIPSHRFEALSKAYQAQIGELLGEEEGGQVDPPSSMVELLPTNVGLGGGGTGEGDYAEVAVANSLIGELKAKPEDLLAIQVEGDSMKPDFLSGDQLLVDRRKVSTAQPGAFCIWEGDGYVVKLIERIYGSEPPRLRVISANNRYETSERLAEEVRVMGRVVYVGRRV